MKPSVKTLSGLLIVSAIITVLSFFFAIEFSSFGIGMIKFTLGVSMVWAFDNFAVPEINTVMILGENPIAYAIFFLGLCLIAAACISVS